MKDIHCKEEKALSFLVYENIVELVRVVSIFPGLNFSIRLHIKTSVSRMLRKALFFFFFSFGFFPTNVYVK